MFSKQQSTIMSPTNKIKQLENFNVEESLTLICIMKKN